MKNSKGDSDRTKKILKKLNKGKKVTKDKLSQLFWS